MNKKLFARYLVGSIVSLVGGGLFLFGSAGRIDWLSAWGVLGVNAFMMAAMGWVIFRQSPDLAAERFSPPKDAKRWDLAVNSGVRLIQLARYIVAG